MRRHRLHHLRSTPAEIAPAVYCAQEADSGHELRRAHGSGWIDSKAAPSPRIGAAARHQQPPLRRLRTVCRRVRPALVEPRNRALGEVLGATRDGPVLGLQRMRREMPVRRHHCAKADNGRSPHRRRSAGDVAQVRTSQRQTPRNASRTKRPGRVKAAADGCQTPWKVANCDNSALSETSWLTGWSGLR